MAKVSIIVPVFNVERYLARCLDSCINQTFEDVEIICVNDGSTDKSADILEAYANLDSRIKIITKENGGLSSARNSALEVAQGEYILFVDSDDYVSSIAVEKLYDKAQSTNSDVIMFDYFWLNSDVTKRRVLTIEAFMGKYVNSLFDASNLPVDMYKFIPVPAWTKFYKTSLIKDNGITFDEGLIYEDIAFWAKIFVKAEKIIYIQEPLYAYFVGRDDQIMARDDEKLFDIIKIYEIVENAFKTAGMYEKFKPAIDLLMIMDFLKKLSSIKPELRESLFFALKNLNKDIDYSYYNGENNANFEKIFANKFKLLNEVESFDEFEKLQKGVFNVK